MDERVKEIYTLRRNGELSEALEIAIQLCDQEPYDENLKALGWVLIDLCKSNITMKNLSNAHQYFSILSSIQFKYEDEFVDTLKKQINLLKPRIDIHYSEIQQIEELSRKGQEKIAFEKIRFMISKNQVSEANHEIYGWILYRYIKSAESDASSLEIRSLLRDYMNLKNERPSMLHSMILNLALNYSKNHVDFNFNKFFILWDPKNLRYEDLNDGYKDGKNIPSLISRICREYVNNNTNIDIENDLISKISIKREILLDLFRKQFYWLLFNAHKENRISELWELFSQYNNTYSKYGKSEWHSEILKLADRFMKDSDTWRFLLFFEKWDPAQLRDTDWKEEKGNDGEIYKPLAIKAIKKSFEIIKNKQIEASTDYSWLIQLYTNAIKLYPSDEWLIREKALIHIIQKDYESAKDIYKKLVLELGNNYYVWQEFAECFDNDNELKIGMLLKALNLENNEDYLGDIHLKLAEILINENLLENALFELSLYKNHRIEKGWKFSDIFESLLRKVNHVELKIVNNQDLYDKFIPLAEHFAYDDLAWDEVVLADKWLEDKKEKLYFTNGVDIEFTIGAKMFPILKYAKIGETFKVKCHVSEINKGSDSTNKQRINKTVIEKKVIPILIERIDKVDWSILPEKYGLIEYINQDKKTLHIINNDSDLIFYQFDKDPFAMGGFVVFRQFRKKVKDEVRFYIKEIHECDKEIAISHFKNRIAVISDINESKKLFHYILGRNLLSGNVYFNDTDIRPSIGDFLKVYYYVKKDKEGKKWLVTLKAFETEEQNLDIRKAISGRLVLKNKHDDWDEDNSSPSFALIGNYYVPKSILSMYHITSDCNVSAMAVYTGDGDRWKVYEISR